jgi:arylsulfatase A-like enzyme
MTAGEERSQRKPNLVLILADDLGFSDLGCYGAQIKTPHLDSMAREGVRFTQMYNCARCCPSRASLLTGLYPHQAGIGYMVRDLGTPAYQGYLRDDCVTIAEALKGAGYQTLICGKWHVGGRFDRSDPDDWHLDDPKRPIPLDRGFDEWYGTPAGAGSYYNPGPLFRNRKLIQPTADGYYYTDAISEHAVSLIEGAATRKKPFFLHVAYTAPHWPLHAPKEDVAQYLGHYEVGWDAVRTSRQEELKGSGILSPRWPISARDEKAPPWESVPHKEWEDTRMAVYAAQVSLMDRGIGRITAKLEELGLAEDTLVVFLSDNGGCAELLGEDGYKARELTDALDGRPVRFGNRPDITPGGPTTYQSYDLPWANASNTPFRLYKHWVHEGGISTPMIASWPGHVPAGVINHSVLHVADFMATFLELADAAYPTEHNDHSIQPTEGESFVPILEGQKWERERPLFWEHEGNRAVRDGRWKLVSKYPGDWELYDMVEDRTELNDLAERNKPRVEKMVAMYNEWADRCEVIPRERILARRRRAKGGAPSSSSAA